MEGKGSETLMESYVSVSENFRFRQTDIASLNYYLKKDVMFYDLSLGPVSLMGHSMGGRTIMMLAALYSQVLK